MCPNVILCAIIKAAHKASTTDSSELGAEETRYGHYWGRRLTSVANLQATVSAHVGTGVHPLRLNDVYLLSACFWRLNILYFAHSTITPRHFFLQKSFVHWPLLLVCSIRPNPPLRDCMRIWFSSFWSWREEQGFKGYIRSQRSQSEPVERQRGWQPSCLRVKLIHLIFGEGWFYCFTNCLLYLYISEPGPT